MDTSKSFRYFGIDEIELTGLDFESFYPVIEAGESGKDEYGTATAFYIKTQPSNLKFILLPADTKLRKKSPEKEE